MDGKSFRILFGIEEQPTKEVTKLRDKFADYCQSGRVISLATHLRGRRPGVKV